MPKIVDYIGSKLNINVPCKLCREEAINVSGEKYCIMCYKEILTMTILKN